MTKPLPSPSAPRDQDYSDRYGTVDFPLKPHVSPHGRVTAVSMMKDEGPFLLEWVAHHLSIGFTDLVIYTNDCSDGTDDMLIRLEELGLVHHRRNDIPDGVRPQPSALNHAQREPIVQNSDWVLVFDADEFLCLKVGARTLDDLITATEDARANGIVITWRIFGSNGIQIWSRAPVTEQYLSAAPPMWNKGWGVKTLFKYDPDYWKLGIHRPKIKKKHLEGDFAHSVRWLNGSGRLMEDYFKFRGWRSIARTVGYDWAQMNHYAIKSMDSYAIRKLRGNVNNKADKYNPAYWALQDRNEVHDDAALKHKDMRQEVIALLLTDPVLSELHVKAIEMTEERLQVYRSTPEYVDLISQLQTASEVPIREVEAKPPQPRDPKKIAAQMSQVERLVTERPQPMGAPPSAAADSYLTGHIDLSEKRPVKSFENHGILIPAEPRIFTANALQTITEGKFLRNHARRLPGLLRPGDRYLEIGAGVGFLGALLARSGLDLHITAQEERRPLYVAAFAIWEINKITQGDAQRLVDTGLFQATDGQHDASGLVRLIAVTDCDVLLVNDPRLSAGMIANALSAQAASLPRAVIVGPRALSGVCMRDACRQMLADLEYTSPAEQPLACALTFFQSP